MNSKTNRRFVALAIAVAGSALLQACAVSTGAFSPSRPTNTNRSMVSHYDVLHQQAAPSHSIGSTRSGGTSVHKYY